MRSTMNRRHPLFPVVVIVAAMTLSPSFYLDETRRYQLAFGSVARAQIPSFKDVLVSPDPPTDEQEDPGFPKPGENPVPIEFFDAYSWRLFVALNWPAKDGTRGMADQSKEIGDVGAQRVWETWKSVEDVFLPGGKEPMEWGR